MQKVTESDYFSNIIDICDFPFGTFYVFKGLVIGEIKEGIVIRWHHMQLLIKKVNTILGEEDHVAYISNRVNSYTMVLTDWIKFRKTEYFSRFSAYAVVAYTETAQKSFTLEAIFSAISNIKKFDNLDDAIEWSMQSNNKLSSQKS